MDRVQSSKVLAFGNVGFLEGRKGKEKQNTQTNYRRARFRKINLRRGDERS